MKEKQFAPKKSERQDERRVWFFCSFYFDKTRLARSSFPGVVTYDDLLSRLSPAMFVEFGRSRFAS
jgi:hypothetical protein